jgi:hypothetical protein
VSEDGTARAARRRRRCRLTPPDGWFADADAKTAITAGLLLLYTFDEGAGPEVHDSSESARLTTRLSTT